MRFLFYTHSLRSDWNHGNAHFLRGVMRALVAGGHAAEALEPADGWSRANLIADQGPKAEEAWRAAFPDLGSRLYDAGFDHEAALAAADVVIVHEWTDPGLIARIGRARAAGGRFALLFHDTHHRAVSAEPDIAAMELDGYDAVLAFGATLQDRYRARGWGRQVHVWHEAADVALFHPQNGVRPGADLIWIGNWGDGERADELDRFLIAPVRALGISATVRGVRYPQDARDRLAAAGIAFGGWIANTEAPAAFARHRVTVHVPRRPYVETLRGIPTIRMFEALACGIPLVSAPWHDDEGLFRSGVDYLTARDGTAMRRHLRSVLHDRELARTLAANGRETILRRHTCGHRVAELLTILRGMGVGGAVNGHAAGTVGSPSDLAGCASRGPAPATASR